MKSPLSLAIVLALYAPLRAQCPDGSPPPCRQAAARAAPARSLAVLYVQDLSRDTANTAVADGLSEEIIARLSQVSGLRVASRYASLRYRGRRAPDPRQVSRELRPLRAGRDTAARWPGTAHRSRHHRCHSRIQRMGADVRATDG